mmetsp:Transcript_2480/g.6477  ORF Transcript_2480/g.6477 Transcript_2480/m.6477 type:complete len:96 (+) Transcript_2480:193-480(+)
MNLIGVYSSSSVVARREDCILPLGLPTSSAPAVTRREDRILPMPDAVGARAAVLGMLCGSVLPEPRAERTGERVSPSTLSAGVRSRFTGRHLPDQ